MILRSYQMLTLVIACIGALPLSAVHATGAEDRGTTTKRYIKDHQLPLNDHKFYGDHSRRWHWYEDPRVEEEEPEQEPSESITLTPEEELKMIKEEVEQLRVKAVLNPTHENVEAYMRVNIREIERGEKFSEAWKRVLWANPELDSTSDRPPTQVGSIVTYEVEKDKTMQALKEASHKYGLFFFFRSNCPYCHKFSPILKEFVTKYGLQIVPISLDGGPLPEWQNPRLDPSNVVAKQFEVKAVPSLFLVDPIEGNVMPVTHGLIGFTELERRIVQLTTQDIQQLLEEQPLAKDVDVDMVIN